MRRLLLPLAVLATAAPVSSASAKGVASGAICGPAGCKQVTDGNTRHRMVEFAEEVAGPLRAAPHYRLRMKVGADGHFERVRAYYVPSQRLLGLDQGGGMVNWGRVTAGSSTLLGEASRGVRPFPASGLQRFVVADQPALTPATAPAQPDDGGFPWLLVTLGLGGASAAAGIVLARRRLPTGQ